MELCVGSWDILPRHGTFCSGTWGLPPTPWEYRGGGEGMRLLLRGQLCASLATSRAPIATIWASLATVWASLATIWASLTTNPLPLAHSNQRERPNSGYLGVGRYLSVGQIAKGGREGENLHCCHFAAVARATGRADMRYVNIWSTIFIITMSLIQSARIC